MNQAKRITRKIKIKPITKPIGIKYAHEDYNGDEHIEFSMKNLLSKLDAKEIEAHNEDDAGAFEIHVKEENKNIYFSFEAERLPNCCGIIELGCLSNQILSDKDMDELFNWLFVGNHKTIMINTIGKQTAWIEYLTKSKFFTNIKSFKNGIYGKSNTITMWVSNN